MCAFSLRPRQFAAIQSAAERLVATRFGSQGEESHSQIIPAFVSFRRASNRLSGTPLSGGRHLGDRMRVHNERSEREERNGEVNENKRAPTDRLFPNLISTRRERESLTNGWASNGPPREENLCNKFGSKCVSNEASSSSRSRVSVTSWSFLETIQLPHAAATAERDAFGRSRQRAPSKKAADVRSAAEAIIFKSV